MIQRVPGQVALLLCTLLTPAVGQIGTEVTGVIIEAGTLRPIGGVVVQLDFGGPVARAGDDGRFSIPNALPGSRVLSFYGWGFKSLAFRVEVPGAGVRVNLGEVVLDPASGPGIRVEGSVSDTAGAAIGGAVISLDGRTVGLSDPQGRFMVVTSGSPASLFEIRRIGYEALAVPVVVPDTATVVSVAAVVQAIPLRLADIVIEGNRTTVIDRKLRDFYRRREMGHGRFVTRADLERFPTHNVTDALRRVGVRVDHGGVGSPTVLSLRRCVPQILIDGFLLTGDFDLDDFLIPEYVAGIEVHVGPATPMELMSGVHACGVIAVWTR